MDPQSSPAVDHEDFFDKYAHSVTLEPDSSLAAILGEIEFEVNSLHHQGVEVVGQGLIPAARAPDGLVEALELPGHPFGLSVQWHPEWLPEDRRSQALFKSFVSTASNIP